MLVAGGGRWAALVLFRFCRWGGLRQFCASKLSPPADEFLDAKRESTSSDKDNSIGLEDDAEGFDLSWLVPSDNLRGMPDIDGDMLERLRTPFHFADN